MSQFNPLVIENKSFPATRADINSALQAVGSNNSYPTEPGVKYANMFWYDETAHILKMRSEANDAWISIGYLHQGENEFHILDDTYVANAQGEHKGLLGDQTIATWEDGTGDTESLVSPAKVKAAVDSLVKGITHTSGSAPYYGCRAFVFIGDGQNASSTWTGQNIASVVRTGVGAYTVTFTIAMPDAEYAVATGPSNQSNPNIGYGMAIGYTAKSASSFSVRTRRVTDHDLFDCDQMSFSVFT
jgi:hypothetical protein